jgi:prepilin-type N-terminal cleavage/methylation domain-containing protein
MRRKRGAEAGIQRGMTLVEVMIAVVLLAVGVLASAGTAAQVVRRIRAAERRTTAANVGEARLERWRSGGCERLAVAEGAGANTLNAGELRERWSLRRAGRVVEGSDTVDYHSLAGWSTLVIAAVLPCAD